MTILRLLLRKWGNKVTAEGEHEVQRGFPSFFWTMFTC